jgi:hypothetical protein
MMSQKVTISKCEGEKSPYQKAGLDLGIPYCPMYGINHVVKFLESKGNLRVVALMHKMNDF